MKFLSFLTQVVLSDWRFSPFFFRFLFFLGDCCGIFSYRISHDMIVSYVLYSITHNLVHIHAIPSVIINPLPASLTPQPHPSVPSTLCPLPACCRPSHAMPPRPCHASLPSCCCCCYTTDESRGKHSSSQPSQPRIEKYSASWKAQKVKPLCGIAGRQAHKFLIKCFPIFVVLLDIYVGGRLF